MSQNQDDPSLYDYYIKLECPDCNNLFAEQVLVLPSGVKYSTECYHCKTKAVMKIIGTEKLEK